MQRYYKSQQWDVGKRKDRKTAIHHKRMGELFCDSESKNDDAKLRWACADEVTDMPMESLEETRKKSERTSEIRSNQTERISMGEQQQRTLQDSA